MSCNSLTELDPEQLNESDTEEWFNFTKDLLQMKHTQYNILLDVGWYPESKPDGVYGLELIKNHDWNNPIVSFDTRNKKQLIEKIEYLLWEVGSGRYN